MPEVQSAVLRHFVYLKEGSEPDIPGLYMGRTVTLGGKQYIEIIDALGLYDFAEVVSGVNEECAYAR